MKSILNEQRRSSIAAAAVTILLGLILVWWPNGSVRLLCMLLGFAVFVTGVIYLLGWISRRREGYPPLRAGDRCDRPYAPQEEHRVCPDQR